MLLLLVVEGHDHRQLRVVRQALRSGLVLPCECGMIPCRDTVQNCDVVQERSVAGCADFAKLRGYLRDDCAAAWDLSPGMEFDVGRQAAPWTLTCIFHRVEAVAATLDAAAANFQRAVRLAIGSGRLPPADPGCRENTCSRTCGSADRPATGDLAPAARRGGDHDRASGRTVPGNDVRPADPCRRRPRGRGTWDLPQRSPMGGRSPSRWMRCWRPACSLRFPGVSASGPELAAGE